MDPNGVCVHVHVHVHAYLPACSPVPSEAQQLGQAAEVCEGGIRGPSHGLHYLQLAPGQHLECATRHWWPLKMHHPPLVATKNAPPATGGH